ncbi:hypothetical protein [Acinetobacter sp. ANC5681]|uniref:hypothetical protein n=1 Tax=Acinetobacter sp. ANC5681 TaxID=2929504 RepID=UPI00201AB78A|nr:hypothetical protein [Acinetobacter sp. ANC5681]MCL5769278.1 hypothetical protein [Acinetobacter sp. ANC5681]
MATMKLQFEDNLDYQRAAIDAVLNLFKGQEITRSEFSVTYRNNDDVNLALFEDTQLGIGNRKLLLDEEIEDNLKRMALLHKDLKYKAPLIEPNLRRNLGKWST